MILEKAWIDDLLVHELVGYAPSANPYQLRSCSVTRPPKGAVRGKSRDHGAIVRTRFYDAAIIDLVGYIRGANDEEREARRDELAHAFSIGGFPHMNGDPKVFKFRRLGFPEDEQFGISAASEFAAPAEGFGGKTLRYAISLIAADPRQYASAVKTAEYDPTSAGTGVGLDFPLDFPLVFAVPEASGLVVENQGNYWTPPVFTVTGPATNPIIDHEATAHSIYTKDLALLAGETATIDVRRKRLTLGADPTPRPDLIDAKMTHWFELDPDSNVLRLRGTGITSASRLGVSYSDARV